MRFSLLTPGGSAAPCPPGPPPMPLAPPVSLAFREGRGRSLIAHCFQRSAWRNRGQTTESRALFPSRWAIRPCRPVSVGERPQGAAPRVSAVGRWQTVAAAHVAFFWSSPPSVATTPGIRQLCACFRNHPHAISTRRSCVRPQDPASSYGYRRAAGRRSVGWRFRVRARHASCARPSAPLRRPQPNAGQGTNHGGRG